MDRSEPTSPFDEFSELLTTTSADSSDFTESGSLSSGRSRPGIPNDVKKKEDFSKEESSYRPLAEYENGILKKLKISSTLIKAILHKGNSIDTCPRKIYETYLTGNYRNVETDVMRRGRYFESRVLGPDKNGRLVDLPLLRNGERSVDQIRIDEQIKAFDIITHNYGMIVIKEGKSRNTQIPVMKKVEYEEYPDVEIVIDAVIDLISPISVRDYNFDVAIFDLKLPMDRNNEHGKFSWGLPQYMDHTQAVLYSHILNLPFFYLLFDYKKNDKGHKLIPVATMAMFPEGKTSSNEQSYLLAKQREIDLKLNIKEVIRLIMEWDYNGYPEFGSDDNCKKCPLNPLNGGSCIHHNSIKET